MSTEQAKEFSRPTVLKNIFYTAVAVGVAYANAGINAYQANQHGANGEIALSNTLVVSSLFSGIGMIIGGFGSLSKIANENAKRGHPVFDRPSHDSTEPEKIWIAPRTSDLFNFKGLAVGAVIGAVIMQATPIIDDGLKAFSHKIADCQDASGLQLGCPK